MLIYYNIQIIDFVNERHADITAALCHQSLYGRYQTGIGLIHFYIIKVDIITEPLYPVRNNVVTYSESIATVVSLGIIEPIMQSTPINNRIAVLFVVRIVTPSLQTGIPARL